MYVILFIYLYTDGDRSLHIWTAMNSLLERDVGVQANLFIRGGVFSYWGIPYSEAVINEFFCRKLTYILCVRDIRKNALFLEVDRVGLPLPRLLTKGG